SSTRNTRIERIWVEVGTQFARQWRAFFYRLERHHHLNHENPRHLWLLQYLFMGPINADCDTFRNEWNSHPISGEGRNQSPKDIFLLGQLENGVYCEDADSDSDEYDNVEPAVLERYHGTTEHNPRQDPESSSNSESSHSSDESEDESEPSLNAQILESIEHQFLPDEVHAPRHKNPFPTDDHTQCFIQGLQVIRDANHIPPRFGMLPEEWDEDEGGEYPTFEMLRLGRRSTKQLRIALPDHIWRPRSVLWVQALDVMIHILEAAGISYDIGSSGSDSDSSSESEGASGSSGNSSNGEDDDNDSSAE
ncbi:hypothetical protein C8J56DRAFT_791666, partial [Mycena floridula]